MSSTMAPMRKEHDALAKLSGQSFRDSDGQRWWVRGLRPGPEAQLVIEAEMKGNYPRIAVYTMTEPEFREHARIAHLRPEKAGAAGREKR
jgi:hypothetical protein